MRAAPTIRLCWTPRSIPRWSPVPGQRQGRAALAEARAVTPIWAENRTLAARHSGMTPAQPVLISEPPAATEGARARFRAEVPAWPAWLVRLPGAAGRQAA